jgi:hypothetical protein
MNALEATINAPIKEVVAFHTNAPKSETERKQGQVSRFSTLVEVAQSQKDF